MPRPPASPVTSGDGLPPARKKPRTSKAAANRQHLITIISVLRQADSEIKSMLARFNPPGSVGSTKEEEGQNRQTDGSCDIVSNGGEAARHA